MKSSAFVFLAGGAIVVSILTVGFLRSPLGQSAEKAELQIPVATPLGITLQVSNERARRGAPQQVFYADAAGMTLYFHAKGEEGNETGCVDCADSWLPAVAPSGIPMPSDAWSLIHRADGTTQWAYRGAPLHIFTGDKAIGDVNGDDGGNGTWQAAVFSPGADIIFPAGISVREIADAGGAGLVDSRGMTLYVFDGDATHKNPSCAGGGHCAGRWLPFRAPAIGSPTGDFSVIVRNDGIAQWTFRGNPLYTFDADEVAGDAIGITADERFHVALIVRHFMPADVTIRPIDEIGGVRSIVSTSSGATLYHHDRVIPGEGRGFRFDHGSPTVGRLIGTASCDERCAKTWRPFIAPADARPSGYWDIAERTDDTRQWVYKGFALYTYAADRPGDISGNESYDLGQIGEDPIIPNGPGVGISAMVWHAVLP